jgi:hypothetical protein
MNELSDARLIKLPRFMDPGGDGLLVVTEAGEQVPFHQIQRMFTIVARALVPNADTTPIGFVRNSCCVSAAHLTLSATTAGTAKHSPLISPKWHFLCHRGSGSNSMLSKMTRLSSSYATGHMKCMTISTITLSFCHSAKSRGHEWWGITLLGRRAITRVRGPIEACRQPFCTRI